MQRKPVDMGVITTNMAGYELLVKPWAHIFITNSSKHSKWRMTWCQIIPGYCNQLHLFLLMLDSCSLVSLSYISTVNTRIFLFLFPVPQGGNPRNPLDNLDAYFIARYRLFLRKWKSRKNSFSKHFLLLYPRNQNLT